MGRWNRLVLPLTEELSKSRLFHDARYFSLDTLNDLPRYVTKDSVQTVLDDKSGYDHILLTESSQTFFGTQWGGWFLRKILCPLDGRSPRRQAERHILSQLSMNKSVMK